MIINQKEYKLSHTHICMEESVKLEKPKCKKCGSQQIRTTSKYRICIRCGNKEKIE